MTNSLALQTARLLQAAGISVSVPAATLATTLQATAAQYAATLETDQLIPAFIWAANQVLALLPASPSGYVFSGNYGGNPPPFNPTTPGAIAIDSVTRRQWQWANLQWS